MTHPNSPKGALLRHGYTLHKDPRYPHSERRTVKDSAGVVVLDDAPDGHPNSPVYGHLKLPHLN